jgi:hypothetical protein
MTETLAGTSRSVRPSREPVPTGASIGNENVFSFSEMTSTRSSWTTGCADVAVVSRSKLSGRKRREEENMDGRREAEVGRKRTGF